MDELKNYWRRDDAKDELYSNPKLNDDGYYLIRVRVYELKQTELKFKYFFFYIFS